MPDDAPVHLSTADAADRHGLTAGEWLAYVRRRQAPPPTGRRLGRPTWSPAVVEAWERPTPPIYYED